MRTLLRGAIAVLLALLLVAGAAFGWLQTPPGKRQLAGLIEWAASDESLSLEIGEIDGLLPFEARLSAVTIADADGVWLRVESAALDWSPLAILSGRLDVETVSLGRVTVERQPTASGAAGGGAFAMPLPLRVARFEAAEIRLAEPVLGAAVRLSMVGTAMLADPVAGYRMAADIRRIDATPGSLSVEISYDPGSGRLTAEITAGEPAGGVIARLLQLPGLPPVSLGFLGDGVLQDWQAELAFDAGPGLAADAQLGIASVDGGYRLGVEAGATLDALAPDPLRDLIAGRNTVRGTAMIGPDGVARFDGVRLGLAAGEVVIAGIVDPPGGTLDVRATAEVASTAVFAGALPGIGWDRAVAGLHASGALADPRLEVEAEVQNVTSNGAAAARLVTNAVLGPGFGGNGQIPFEGQGSLEGLSLGEPDLDTLLAPPITWRVSGNHRPDGVSMIERMEIASAAATMAGTGVIDAAGAIEADGTLTLADLKLLRPVVGLPIDGRAQASWQASSSQAGLALQADASIGDLRSGLAEFDALLADTVVLRSDAVIGWDGAVDVTGLQAESGGNAVAARLRFAEQVLSTDWSVTVPSLLAVARTAGIDLDGRLDASGRLHGPLEDLLLEAEATGRELQLNGRVLPDLRGSARVEDLAGRSSGTIRLEATIADRPARLEARLLALADGGYRFDPVAGEAAGSAVSGAIDLLADGLITGRLEGSAADVAPLAGLFDVPLSGSTELVAILAASEGRQSLQATLEMTGAAFDREIAAATISADMTIDDLLDEARIDGRAEAQGVRTGGVAFDRAAVSAQGRADALAFSVALAGDQYSGEAAGAWVVADRGSRLDLDSLVGDFRGESFALAGPTSVSVGIDTVSIDPAEIRLGGGRVAVHGAFGPTIDASLEVSDVPMGLLSLVVPGHPVVGRLNGAARLSGSAARPEGSFEFRVDELRYRLAEDAGLPPPDVIADGRFSDGRLALRVAAEMSDGSKLDLDADVPFEFVPGTAAPVFDTGSSLAASAAGTVDVALFDDLLAAAGNRVDGRLTLDLEVSGTVGKPIVAGTLVLSDGEYHNAFYGSRLADISAVVTASGTELRLTELSATTPDGGTLQGGGSLALDRDRDYPVVLDVRLRNGSVVDTDLATATADADLRLSGSLVDKLLLSGEISILGAEFRIPDRLPSSVVDLPVEERNVPPEIVARRAARAPSEPAAAFDATLDLVASASQSVFVRGRGLDVELAGEMTIKGTAAEPAIGGALGLRGGTFDLLGRRLTFRRGGLGFDGSSELDPEVDLLATADVDDYAIEVDIGGRVSNPTLTLTSVPELPDDEIASRLLFGKDVGSLSAFEALALAESAGQLTGVTGGSSGLIGSLRDTTGLDRLAVETGDETGDASVAGGRYVGEGVYVGVEQGLDEQSSRVNVEVELTPNVTVESDVGADAQGRIGVRMEWDY